MPVRLGVNGFGRIGRMVVRAAFSGQHQSPPQVACINDPFMNVDYLIYLLKYDSAHGRFNGHVEKKSEHCVLINGHEVQFTTEKDPSTCKWGDNGVKVVAECTGAFLTQEKAAGHFKGGAKKVLLSAPAKDDTPTFVMGVNHKNITADMNIVSNASCTTNCLAPMSKVLQDNFGIKEGLMTTVHATTSTQLTIDGAAKGGKDWRGGRAAGINIIPSSTGAAKAVGLVIPELKGMLTGMAFRVPTVNVSCVDLTVKLNKSTSYAEIMEAYKEASRNEMKGVLHVMEDQVVSQDIMTDPRTSIIDAKAGIGLNDTFFKIVSWYDNEWGYSCKMLDLANHVAKTSGI